MAIVKLIDTPEDPVRLAFLYCFEKRPGMVNADGTKGADKYEVNAILKPGGANAKRVEAAIEEVAKEKYGTKLVKNDDGVEVPAYKAILAEFDDDQSGLRKGNRKKDKGGSIYAGFEGQVYVQARNTARPTVIDRDKTPLGAADGKPYAGCYSNVHIDVWALNKPGVKKRIVTDLTGIQFSRDGDAFGSGSAPADPDQFDDLGAGPEPEAEDLMG